MAEEYTPLASENDVVAAFGRALTASEGARVDAILRKASALFRMESGQQFTPGESSTRLKVNGGSVYLPQRPVVEVLSVTDDVGRAVAGWTRHSQWLQVPRISHEFVIVAYTHGGAIPELVRLTIADVARQVLSINSNAAEGVTQYSETAGPFTSQSTYATWAQGGAARLAPDDITVARSFRTRLGNVWVQGS